VSDAEVASVHEAAILIDTHDDITSRTVDGLHGRRLLLIGWRPSEYRSGAGFAEALRGERLPGSRTGCTTILQGQTE
jgi:hypothetical protein